MVIGDYLKGYTTCGTLLYWTAVLSIVPVVLLVTLIVRWHLVADYHAKERAGYVWLEGDVEWSEWNTIVYPLICSLAGVVAGAFGVGGGIVKVRILCLSRRSLSPPPRPLCGCNVPLSGP